MIANGLPTALAGIVEDFKLAEGSEKLELLLGYSESLPPIPEGMDDPKAPMESVPECMTPVSIAVELKEGGVFFYFRVPQDSPTVRGYAAILSEGLNGLPPEEVVRIPSDFYLEMGLQQLLTPQRLNGMAAIIAHVKRLALEKMETSS